MRGRVVTSEGLEGKRGEGGSGYHGKEVDRVKAALGRDTGQIKRRRKKKKRREVEE